MNGQLGYSGPRVSRPAWVAVLLCLAGAQGCTGFTQVGVEDTLYGDASESLAVLELETGVSLLTLSVNLKVDEGELLLEVTDPDNRLVFQKAYHGGDREQAYYDFQPVPGTWSLRVGSSAGRGWYAASLGW